MDTFEYTNPTITTGTVTLKTVTDLLDKFMKSRGDDSNSADSIRTVMLNLGKDDKNIFLDYIVKLINTLCDWSTMVNAVILVTLLRLAETMLSNGAKSVTQLKKCVMTTIKQDEPLNQTITSAKTLYGILELLSSPSTVSSSNPFSFFKKRSPLSSQIGGKKNRSKTRSRRSRTRSRRSRY